MTIKIGSAKIIAAVVRKPVVPHKNMHPSTHARISPNHAACIMAGTGEVVTYEQLERRSNRLAHFFRSQGLVRGDTVAVLLNNGASFFDVVWAAQRAALYYTCISPKLAAAEIQYILSNSGCKLLVTESSLASSLDRLPLDTSAACYTFGATSDGYRSLDAALAAQPVTPIADESPGIDMLYSSGTTGRPKGIRPQLPPVEPLDSPNPLARAAATAFGIDASTIYLSPAPLYHAAPLRTCMTVQRFGGTVLVMDRFDAEHALKLIAQHKVTLSQWVPTHFVRMLRLPPSTRLAHDMSSMRIAVHAAAPCPIPVKQAMIDWWGPILVEFYGGTENNGTTVITSQEWLEHKGSVGRALPPVRIEICDPDGAPVPARVQGLVFFVGGPSVTYHGDPEKSEGIRNRTGGTTLGDVGWLDEDGYLYLTDRADFMIISGGVNIYPQEIENVLIGHPQVADVAVVGAPDEEMGEKVVAVIQPECWADAGTDLADELVQYVRARLSHVKTPRKIDFVEALPRMPTGKLLKRQIRASYWPPTPAR